MDAPSIIMTLIIITLSIKYQYLGRTPISNYIHNLYTLYLFHHKLTIQRNGHNLAKYIERRQTKTKTEHIKLK